MMNIIDHKSKLISNSAYYESKNPKMTFEQLIMLQAIVVEGTFRGAAQRLHKSQSALSHALKKLEDEVGFAIFSRDQYRPQLTPAGDVFYKHAAPVLQTMHQLKLVAKQLEQHQEPEITLTLTATCPIKTILGIVHQLNQTYPATHIKLLSEMMGGPLERLMQGDADVMIATMDKVPTEQVEAFPFTEISIIPVAYRRHPLVQHNTLIPIDTLQTYNQIIVTDSSQQSSYAQSRDVLSGGKSWSVTDFQTKKEILLANMGWGGMPEHLIRDELQQGILIPLDIENFPIRRSTLYAIRRNDRSIGLVGQALWAALASMRKMR